MTDNATNLRATVATLLKYGSEWFDDYVCLCCKNNEPDGHKCGCEYLAALRAAEAFVAEGEGK